MADEAGESDVICEDDNHRETRSLEASSCLPPTSNDLSIHLSSTFSAF